MAIPIVRQIPSTVYEYHRTIVEDPVEATATSQNTTHAYEVKPGTQTDTKIRLRGKGVPTLRNDKVRGDHYVTLVVQVPANLSKEAKEKLKEFDELSGDSLNTKNGADASEKKKGPFGRHKK